MTTNTLSGLYPGLFGLEYACIKKHSTLLILPRVDHLCRYIIYAYHSPMTTQHNGNSKSDPKSHDRPLRYSTVLHCTTLTLLICVYNLLSCFWSLVPDSSQSVLETMEKKEQMQFLMRHQREFLRWTPFDMQEPAQHSFISNFYWIFQ